MAAKIKIKSPREIEKMKRSGSITAELLRILKDAVKPGLKTRILDEIAEKYIISKGAKSLFKGFKNYPASVCVSVNHQVVHGIPGDYVLREGDIVDIDVGLLFEEYAGDTSETIYVGDGKPPIEIERFLNAGRKALETAIEAMRVGNRLGDICYAMQNITESNGYSVVRRLVGHGIGRSMHEPPSIPVYGKPATGPIIREGMVFAIEPMINMGGSDVVILEDGWTVITSDGKLSCHFEHTVAATMEGPTILTI